MGISLAYVAVRGLSQDEILSRLELGATGIPSTSVCDELTAGPLPGGWFLVTALGCDHRIVRPDTMAVLSAGCEAVMAAVEEHVSFSHAELWRDAKRVWQVSHEGSEDPQDLTGEGETPPRIHELIATVDDSLEGHDYFDIPLILSQELCGYRYDAMDPAVDPAMDPAIDAAPFEQLRDQRPPPVPWWKRWFGRLNN